MSADELDETTITVVGRTGIAASLGVIISETYSSLEAQRRRIELTEGLAQRRRILEEPVEEVSGEEFTCVQQALKF